MFDKLISALFKALGKSGYKLDPNISKTSLFILYLNKIIQFIRYTLRRVFFKSSSLIGFIGKHVVIDHANRISVGKSLSLHDGVKINGLARRGIKIGNNVSVKSFTMIDCAGVYSEIGDRLIIGNNVGISEYCLLQVRAELVIEDDVIIGPGVKIFTEEHVISDVSSLIRTSGVERKTVIIENGAWIGASSTILAGVRIGTGAVVAAGSVVKHDVPKNSVVAGVPARLVKRRG